MNPNDNLGLFKQVPKELEKPIFDFLGLADGENLSLVSKHFLEQGKKVTLTGIYLYHHGSIHKGSLPGARLLAGPFNDTDIEKRNARASSVKALEINGDWVATDENLPKALALIARFKKLEYLAITDVKSTSWTAAPDATKKAIAALCALPSLTTISLNSAPFRILEFCSPSVKNITLGRNLPLFFDNEVFNALSWQGSEKLAPETISISGGDLAALQRLVALSKDAKINLGSVKNIEMDVQEASAWYLETVPELLNACSASLETLAWEAFVDGEDPTQPKGLIDLSSFPKLNNLIVSFGRQFPKEGSIDPIVWVNNRLNTFANPQPSLKLVHLFVVVRSKFANYYHYHPKSGEWEEFDQILSNKGRFPSLGKVRIDVKVPIIDDKPFGDNVKTGIKPFLHQLQAVNLLEEGEVNDEERELLKKSPWGRELAFWAKKNTELTFFFE
ncbi:hypothetical protein FA15DRAFT_463198 [Coprinopsis marcescibilis]|uniref:F-box domain-containing protein n=1 Tax=Coprinopsis marcescibilis TaxID=230819 RepID=A0A5C3KUJ8_COPMA|nr:hypothetical protein FA15DRAFT_463198 [Coprinopsis marcescibilis]